MKTTKSKQVRNEDAFVTLNEATGALRISKIQMEELLVEKKVDIYTKGEQKYIKKHDLKNLVDSDEAAQAASIALVNGIKIRIADKTSGANVFFLAKLDQKIVAYKEYIIALEVIHKKYIRRFDVLNSQTASVAAYVLFSRVITLLKMACLCLENRYWESLLFLRLIDEAIDLAEYFLITQNTEKGMRHLNEWFKENKSPKNETCREAISKFYDSIPPLNSNGDMKEEMGELYRIKSKSIHHTFNEIIEVFNATMTGAEISQIGFDYGPCSYPRKIAQLVDFFQSSIWTSVQGLLICFGPIGGNILSEEDVIKLRAINETFYKETDG